MCKNDGKEHSAFSTKKYLNIEGSLIRNRSKVFNIGNTPTFVTKTRQEVIDITNIAINMLVGGKCLCQSQDN